MGLLDDLPNAKSLAAKLLQSLAFQTVKPIKLIDLCTSQAN